MLLAASFIFVPVAQGQKYAPPFPREASTKADESQCFIIWNLVYESGKSTGMRMAPLDQITVFWTEGSVKFTRPDGTWTIEQEKVGSIRFESKGTIETEEGLSEAPPPSCDLPTKGWSAACLASYGWRTGSTSAGRRC